MATQQKTVLTPLLLLYLLNFALINQFIYQMFIHYSSN